MTTDEINGLRVFVKGTELAEMSAKAITYHIARIAEYTARAAMLRDMSKAAADAMEPAASRIASKTYNADPGDAVEQNIASHHRRMRMHEFIRDHVATDRVYSLTINELNLWGIENH